MTKEQAIKKVQDVINSITEEGSEDVAAWEYRADLFQIIENIKSGGNIEEELGNI